LVAQREVAHADTEIASLLKEFPNAAPVHALSGTLKATKKDVAGARREYERALVLDPASMEALTGLVLLDIAEKNIGRARERVDARLAVQPDRSDLLVLAARVYATAGDNAKAERTLRHVIEVNPTGNVGYAMLGQLYLRQGKLDDAKAEFERRVKANPKDVGAQTMLGMILETQRNLPDAKKKYDEVLALDARSVVASNNLAYIYAEEGQNLDRALQLAQVAVDQMPDSPEIRDTLGWVYYKKNLPDLAAKEFEQSIAKDPANPAFHYHLGLAYSKSGDLVRARQSFEAALKLKPDYPEARQGLQSVAG
jgi:tetratricopeptide (TPR) repeat protein